MKYLKINQKLCDQKECINSDKNIVNIKYDILETPVILSFKIKMNKKIYLL